MRQLAYQPEAKDTLIVAIVNQVINEKIIEVAKQISFKTLKPAKQLHQEQHLKMA